MLKQIRTYKSKKNKNTMKSKKTQPIRRSTRNKIIAKALAANSMAPFECSHPAIQQIAKDAIKEHHYMATYGDQESGLMIINHIPTPKQHDRENSILKISQETRIQALLERHNMSNCQPKLKFQTS